MVDANLTYLDPLNRYIVLCYYKALTGLSEKSLVSTKPKNAKVQSYETNLWNIATNKILSIVFNDILIGYTEIS
jgi:hypothetical protein